MYQKANSSYGASGNSTSGYDTKPTRKKNDGCCEGGCGTACVRYKTYQ